MDEQPPRFRNTWILALVGALVMLLTGVTLSSRTSEQPDEADRVAGIPWSDEAGKLAGIPWSDVASSLEGEVRSAGIPWSD
jgi:hypothetical protein